MLYDCGCVCKQNNHGLPGMDALLRIGASEGVWRGTGAAWRTGVSLCPSSRRESEEVAKSISGLGPTWSTQGSFDLTLSPRSVYGMWMYGVASHGGAPARPDQPRSCALISVAAK